MSTVGRPILAPPIRFSSISVTERPMSRAHSVSWLQQNLLPIIALTVSFGALGVMVYFLVARLSTPSTGAAQKVVVAAIPTDVFVDQTSDSESFITPSMLIPPEDVSTTQSVFPELSKDQRKVQSQKKARAGSSSFLTRKKNPSWEDLRPAVKQWLTKNVSLGDAFGFRVLSEDYDLKRSELELVFLSSSAPKTGPFGENLFEPVQIKADDVVTVVTVCYTLRAKDSAIELIYRRFVADGFIKDKEHPGGSFQKWMRSEVLRKGRGRTTFIFKDDKLIHVMEM